MTLRKIVNMRPTSLGEIFPGKLLIFLHRKLSVRMSKACAGGMLTILSQQNEEYKKHSLW
jgi:hypothetical protein